MMVLCLQIYLIMPLYLALNIDWRLFKVVIIIHSHFPHEDSIMPSYLRLIPIKTWLAVLDGQTIEYNTMLICGGYSTLYILILNSPHLNSILPV